jgi:transcriptional regulator with XRE-family HTH domain
MRRLNLSDLFTVAVGRHGSQVEVAKKCGISQSMVSLYLNGKVRTVKAENILRIARCLGIRPGILLAALAESDANAQ